MSFLASIESYCTLTANRPRQELQETICAEGDRSAFAHYAGIEKDHPLVDLVAEQ